MAAVDSDGTVLHPAYLRVMYDAHKTVRIEEVCHGAGRLGEFCPDGPPDVADRPFYRGDIFSEMILRSLVRTSTVLLRRTRLALVGGFDESLIKSGEDCEFQLHTCAYGPVGFLDAASISYRVGADDQLSAPGLMLYCALNNLTTVRKWLANGKGRITLPVPTIRRHLAECYDWLGSDQYIKMTTGAGESVITQFIVTSLATAPLGALNIPLFARLCEACDPRPASPTHTELARDSRPTRSIALIQGRRPVARPH
jgi:hypothetical protein